MAEAKTYRRRFQDRAKAEKYARRFDQGGRRRIDAREQRAVRTIFAALTDSDTVLDIPSGAGRFVTALGQGGRWVIEADVAFEMVELAARRAAAAGVRAVTLQSDAGRLPLRAAAVDCVFCNRLLHHILNPAERAMFLREFHRVSRRWLVLSFFNYQAFRTVRRVLKMLKGRTTKYAQEPTADDFAAEVAAAGFHRLRIVRTGAMWVAQEYWVLEKALPETHTVSSAQRRRR